LLDAHTQCVIGPSSPSEEDNKEGFQEEDEATAAMLVTVEEDNGTMIKRSQVTEKQLTAIISNNLASKADASRKNHRDSAFDLSLHNHMSIRDLSPKSSQVETENNFP
jgi:hypothetical protein